MPDSTVTIRLLAAEHEEAIQRLASDARISATTRIPHPYPEHGARDYIAAQISARQRGTSWTFAIADHDEIVGVCGIEGIGRDEPPELGYWVGTPYWGLGYASIGVKLVLEFAFQNLLLDQVRAHALEHNTASRRVLEKSGFEFLRIVPHYDPALGNFEQIIAQYLITRPR